MLLPELRSSFSWISFFHALLLKCKCECAKNVNKHKFRFVLSDFLGPLFDSKCFFLFSFFTAGRSCEFYCFMFRMIRIEIKLKRLNGMTLNSKVVMKAIRLRGVARYGKSPSRPPRQTSKDFPTTQTINNRASPRINPSSVSFRLTRCVTKVATSHLSLLPLSTVPVLFH